MHESVPMCFAYRHVSIMDRWGKMMTSQTVRLTQPPCPFPKLLTRAKGSLSIVSHLVSRQATAWRQECHRQGIGSEIPTKDSTRASLVGPHLQSLPPTAREDV